VQPLHIIVEGRDQGGVIQGGGADGHGEAPFPTG
jgi:hypothetical protein